MCSWVWLVVQTKIIWPFWQNLTEIDNYDFCLKTWSFDTYRGVFTNMLDKLTDTSDLSGDTQHID